MLKTNPPIFLTFDIEEWYQAELVSSEISQRGEIKTNLEENVEELMDICSLYNVKSTCFIVGELALRKPKIVKKLHNAGHEISSHSYSHKLIYNMTPDEFRNDLRKSCDILENIIGEKIIGYRAPTWSVNKKIKNWFYDILEGQGMKYSSSIYPGKTFLYGYPESTALIHNPIINGKAKSIIEIPQSLVNILGKRVAFSGGFFLRFFPTWFIKNRINYFNKNDRHVFIYLHPYEIDYPVEYIIKLSFLESFIQFHGIKKCKLKLKNIINRYKDSFTSMKEYIPKS